MTDKKIKQQLLMAYCYSAFDRWDYAWDSVISSNLPRVEDKREWTLEEQGLAKRIEKIHNELCDQELYGIFEEHIEDLAMKMAKGPLEYAVADIDTSNDDDVYENAFMEINPDLKSAKEDYISRAHCSNRYLFLVLKKEEYI